MRRRRPLPVRSIPLLGLLALLRCGEPIDHASDVDTLRVLGVSADHPFAAPGSEVQLRMLLHDGSPNAVLSDGTRRAVHVLWLGSCVNPEGDLYYRCYPVLREAMAGWTDSSLQSQTLPDGTVPGTAGFGTSFALRIPGDTIQSRPQAEHTLHPYGIVYAFYAACAGELRLTPDRDPAQSLPVGCFDPGTGEALGQDDFEVGYFPVYAYDDVTNRHPGLTTATLEGAGNGLPCASPSDCGQAQTCGSAGVCIPRVPRCAADDPDDCPAYSFVPSVERNTLEKAVTANLTEQDAPWETFWVAYFSTGGSFEKDLRMVHDPGSGWQEGYAGSWRARAASGEVRLWAVLRDNRNGVVWSWQDVMVE